MAWITKNSGTMQVDRRKEPYVTEAMKKHFEAEILPRYPRAQAATMPLLHAIQEEYGYIPYQAMEEAGAFLGISASEVMDTATFYEEYFLEPRGRYTIWICQSISCEIMGEPSLTDAISEHLGVDPGETTEDGKFTLMKVECLGACGGAPCALVNEKLHEKLTVENFKKVLGELK